MPQPSPALAFALALSLAAPAAAAPDLAAPADKVILVSCDGMRPDAIAALGPERAPAFHRLMREGAFTLNARTDPTYTITLPNHTGMITGRAVVGEAGHGWISNSDPKLGQTLHRNKGSYIDSMFAVAHDHGLRTALLASKTKFSVYDLSYNERSGTPDTTGEDNGRDKLDTFAIETETDCLVEWFVSLFQATEAPPDLAMLHLRDPDSAGHAHGWSLRSDSDYLEAVAHTDQLVGRVLEVIDSDPSLRGTTYLIVTADHGGLEMTKGHGESEEWQNFRIGFFVWGGQTAHGADLYTLNPSTRKEPGDANPEDDGGSFPPVRNADAANLALTLLGLPPVPGSTVNANQDLRVTGPPPPAPGR